MTLVNKTFSQLITFTRASSATFVGSNGLIQSATTNTPRFDYDPVTLAAKGLLIEEQRTNLLTYSNDWSNAAWVRTNVTITGAATLSPDGTVNASKIESTATGSGVYNSAVVAATSATASVYLKQGTGATIANGIGLRNNTTATNLIVGTLDYSTGVFTYTTGSTGVVVTNVGNGWWRVSLTATAGITSGDTLRFYTGLIGAASTSGDFCYGYGAQLEAGSFATSYIPTVASQVTRSADVASVNTLSPWYNAAEGTLYVEVSTVAASARAATFSAGTITNQLWVQGGGTSETALQVYTAGAFVAQIGVLPSTLTKKIAAAYQTDNFAVSINGGAAATDTSGSIGFFDRMSIGSRFDGVASTNGHIRRITYYKRRLSNADLQSITL